MDPTYTNWFHHGEKVISNDVPPSKTETYHLYEAAQASEEHNMVAYEEDLDDEISQLIKDAETPLYPENKKYTKLSSIVALYKLKTINGWSDSSFIELLEILEDMLPINNVILTSTLSVKKYLKTLELRYEKIHACTNDCCLFRKDKKDLENCPKCGSSRWKVDKKTQRINVGVPAKVLRYFPIKPGFERMFKIPRMVESLIWHSTNRSVDGKMRHPVDSPSWDLIDNKWPEFAKDPRSLRLGLATDGFNPFGNLSSTYSCWPVMLVIYNLPPWLCMKKENILLSLLIPGPKQPGNDIDIYLQPLIDDLHELWTIGINVNNTLAKSIFNLRAILMWTINDLPALGNLAGCTIKGRVGYPVCLENTHSQWLKFSRKFAYMGHRRFLPYSHPFRKKKSWFDGNKEKGCKPKIMTGSNVFVALKEYVNDFGKCGKRKRDDGSLLMWKKRSKFFELPYWEVLPLHHNLDVMHIEKNVCESILGTLLDINGKSKDGWNARKDLQDMGIRQELHPED